MKAGATPVTTGNDPFVALAYVMAGVFRSTSYKWSLEKQGTWGQTVLPAISICLDQTRDSNFNHCAADSHTHPVFLPVAACFSLCCGSN